MKANRKTNPITSPLFFVSTLSVVVLGLSAVMKWEAILDIFAIPLLLLCASLVLAYCVFAMRLGVIGSVSQAGRVSTHSRQKEPFSFYFLWVLYTTLSLSTATYLIGQWVGYFG